MNRFQTIANSLSTDIFFLPLEPSCTAAAPQPQMVMIQTTMMRDLQELTGS